MKSAQWRAALPALAVALAGVACGGRAEAPREELRPVRFEVVRSTSAGRTWRLPGVAQAGVEPRLSFMVPGRVQRLNVQVGDHVEPGHVLAELDPLDYQLQVEDAEASLRRAQAEARNASASFERVRGLFENGNASRTDYDASRAADESAREAVRSIEKRLELARRQLGYTRLSAPLRGAVAELSVEVNETVRAGQSVLRLASAAQIEVAVSVPENLIGGIRQGDPVEVRFDALPEQRFAAAVTEVGVAATGGGATFPVTARLSESAAGVRPGMAAEVAFSTHSASGARRVSLPTQAVGEDRQGRFVFVLEPKGSQKGIVRRRAVSVGALTIGGLEVLEGLADGDRVVTAGVSRLSDGQEVRLASEG